MEPTPMLTIFNDATSPFGRKVIVAALERNVKLRETFVDLAHAEALDAHNPLRQIPTLVTASGSGVYGSMSILLYLDTLHEGAPLVSHRDGERLALLSLADGLMEAVLTRLIESRRPEAKQDAALLAKLEARIWRSIETLDQSRDALATQDNALRAEQLAAAVALEYADFRFPFPWRERFAKLAEWLAPLSARGSFKATVPTRTSPVTSAE
jgi:glutathione S-transferase